MRKLEITISEEQFQNLESIIKKSNSDHLSEGVFGGYELRLNISIPGIFPTTLDFHSGKLIELGEVKWKISKI